MAHSKYLIVGGGLAADAALRGIREVDATGPITVIGDERDLPYDRPPLSKGLWKDKSIVSIWRQTNAPGVEFLLGRTVRTLDPRGKQVTDSQGATYTYDKLLLATGGTPRRLPFGGDDIIYFRTLADYRRLRELTERGRNFAVIGGGFIGSEVAAALAMNDRHVTMAFPDNAVGGRVFPPDLGRFLNDRYRQAGVELIVPGTVNRVERRGERLAVQIQDGGSSGQREILVDGVVAGIGIVPNVELAQAAGLKVDNGIVVDENLATSAPDVYAAGDVAAFFSPVLARVLRFEHEDNANMMGLVAGRNMAGAAHPYHHLPFFYSDLFELGYEAVGELDARLQTVVDWKERYREGVIYYLRDGRVRGVLLWNVWEQVKEARKLIAEPGPFTPENLKHRLPA